MVFGCGMSALNNRDMLAHWLASQGLFPGAVVPAVRAISGPHTSGPCRSGQLLDVVRARPMVTTSLSLYCARSRSQAQERPIDTAVVHPKMSMEVDVP